MFGKKYEKIKKEGKKYSSKFTVNIIDVEWVFYQWFEWCYRLIWTFFSFWCWTSWRTYYYGSKLWFLRCFSSYFTNRIINFLNCLMWIWEWWDWPFGRFLRWVQFWAFWGIAVFRPWLCACELWLWGSLWLFTWEFFWTCLRQKSFQW